MATSTAELQVIDVTEAALILGVHRNSIYKMVQNGALVPIPLRFGKLLFSRSAIENLVNSEAIR